MESILAFLAQLGSQLIAAFVADAAKRAALTASWNAFIANRQARADATVELKTNVEDQKSDLDRVQEELEKKAKEGTHVGTNTGSGSKVSGTKGKAGK